MENIVERWMNRIDTDLDLLDQFRIYEASLSFEDAVSKETGFLLRKTLRSRPINARRISHRIRQAAPPPPPPPPSYEIIPPTVPPLPLSYLIKQNHHQTADDSSSSSGDLNGFEDCKFRDVTAGVTPGLRRRRENGEWQKNCRKDNETNGLQQQQDDAQDYGELFMVWPNFHTNVIISLLH